MSSTAVELPLALQAALRSPSHAYLFSGPRGAGKAAAARTFAADLLAEGALDADDARRRALARPPSHPDLTWVSPPGNQHLVEEIRNRVIATAAYRPFEGARRVFVVEAAEAMAEESQNALLRTLEEPASFAHLILLTSEPEAVLETVRSRCQRVRFAAPSPESLEEMLATESAESTDERRAAARLAAGDSERARGLLGASGRALRRAAEALVLAGRGGDLGAAPWLDLLAIADDAGRAAADEHRAAGAAAEEAGLAVKRSDREAGEIARRVERRARTDALDLGLALVCAWLRDLAAVADGAPDLALNVDRSAELAAAAENLDPRLPRRGAELVMDVRRRLTVNVSEELALETLAFRLEALLSRSR